MASDFEFRIDGWTPATIPQARLGEYLIEVAKLYGEPASVHFDGLRKGSAVLTSKVDGPAIPKVERRLMEVRSGYAAKDAIEAYLKIDDMLADDNTSATLRGRDSDSIVIRFPGRTKERAPEYQNVREDGFVEGELIRIGGRDKSIHVTLQSGDVMHSGIETDRDMARRLGPLIFGPTVRLSGTGMWGRSSDGVWTLKRFIASSFEEIGETSLADALGRIRAIGGSRWHLGEGPTAAFLAARPGEGSDT